MDLTSSLRRAGYDLINSPVRNHKLTQLWLKKDFDKIQLLYEKLEHALIHDTKLNVFVNDALSVNSEIKNEFHFNLGITILDDILKSIGLANLSLSAELKRGKKVTISYDNSISKEIEIGSLNNYLSEADFLHPNNLLLNYLNKDNVIIVTGVLYAKNLLVEIDTDFSITAELQAKLALVSDGKIDFDYSSDKKIKMTAQTGDYYPIAIKANRLKYDHGKYKDQKLVTDNRNFF